jgi:hypothetical protein
MLAKTLSSLHDIPHNSSKSNIYTLSTVLTRQQKIWEGKKNQLTILVYYATINHTNMSDKDVTLMLIYSQSLC